MLGRGRSRREYRVYAEDQFLDAEDAFHEEVSSPAGWPEDDPSGMASVDGWPEETSSDGGPRPVYTAPPRRLPGAGIRRMVGIALLAAVAMLLSAIVVHALRSAVDAGGAGRQSATIPPPAGEASAMHGVRRHDGATVSARAAALRAAATTFPADVRRSRRAGQRPLAPMRASARVSTISASTGRDAVARRRTASADGESSVPATAPANAVADDVLPVVDDVAAVSAPANPEFGFERQSR
jgi:hypothetical protein